MDVVIQAMQIDIHVLPEKMWDLVHLVPYHRIHKWPLRQGVLDTTLCDKVCQLLDAGQWFSACAPISSTNKTDNHNIIEILLKVALNTMNQTKLYFQTDNRDLLNQFYKLSKII
jgi:hypothetical protein